MTPDLAKMQPALERQLGLLGFELVLAERAKEGRDTVLRLYIDHLDAERTQRKITLDDCVAANDGLVAWLDVEFPDLREEVALEISSPGMERPLVKAAHFRRFAGRLCRIQTRLPLHGQKRFKGWIGPCTDVELTLEEDGALKAIPLDEIQKARLAPFDEARTPPARHVQAVLTGPPDADFEPGPTELGGVETSPAVEE